MNGRHPERGDDFDSQGGARDGVGQRGFNQPEGALERDSQPGYPTSYPGGNSRDYSGSYSDDNPRGHGRDHAGSEPAREHSSSDREHGNGRQYIGQEYRAGRQRWRTQGNRARWPDQESWEPSSELGNARGWHRDRHDAAERLYSHDAQDRGYGYYRAAGQHRANPGFQDQDFGAGGSDYQRPEWRRQDLAQRGGGFDRGGADRDYGLQGYGRGGYAEDYGSGRGEEMYQREWQQQGAPRQPYGTTHNSYSPLGDRYMADRGRHWGAFGGAGWSLAQGEGFAARDNPYDDHRSHRGRGPKGYVRSDERIKEDVCERLTHDDDVDASEITVECENGAVTLTGTVERRRIKHHVEDLVETVPGVTDIDNHLKVHHRWFHRSEEPSHPAADEQRQGSRRRSHTDEQINAAAAVEASTQASKSDGNQDNSITRQ